MALVLVDSSIQRLHYSRYNSIPQFIYALTLHGVRFAWSCLPVEENGTVIALHCLAYQIIHATSFIHVFLTGLLSKHAVKTKLSNTILLISLNCNFDLPIPLIHLHKAVRVAARNLTFRKRAYPNRYLNVSWHLLLLLTGGVSFEANIKQSRLWALSQESLPIFEDDTRFDVGDVFTSEHWSAFAETECEMLIGNSLWISDEVLSTREYSFSALSKAFTKHLNSTDFISSRLCSSRPMNARQSCPKFRRSRASSCLWDYFAPFLTRRNFTSLRTTLHSRLFLRETFITDVDSAEVDGKHRHVYSHEKEIPEPIEYFPHPVLVQCSVLVHAILSLLENFSQRLGLTVIHEIEVKLGVGVVVAAEKLTKIGRHQ